MASELTAWLFEATLAGSAAILVVLMLRRPLRAAFGAGAAYAAWGLVPAALLATLLPAATAPIVPAEFAVTMVEATGLPAAIAARPFAVESPLAALWAAGLVAMALLLVRQQRRFLRGLGTLHRRDDGLYQSDAVAGLPAVIGWRSRIVLPRDFEQRYAAHEQSLVLCHEQVHRRRGDLPAGAFVAVLRCVFWFNPLVHFAAGRFRHDQELACDAAVLRRFPNSRRSYGDALLKTQLADQPLPLGCHWFGSHPLKERIAMLKNPLPNKPRWIAGFVLVCLLCAATGWTAWAAQPAAAAAAGDAVGDGLSLQMKTKLNGGKERIENTTMQPGQPKSFSYDEGGERWQIALTLTRTEDGSIFIAAEILRDGVVQGQPRLLTKPGVGAAIGIGDRSPGGFKGVEIEMLVTDAAATTELAEGLAGPVPAYPKELVAAGEGGVVMLRVLVGADGKALRSEYHAKGSTVPETSPLVKSAIDSSLQWTFRPAVEEGRAAEGWVEVPVRFEPGDGT